MKINGSNPVGAVNQYKKNQESQQASTGQRIGKKKDQVEISSEAKELLETRGASPASREKIEALTNSVSSGTYHVDARTLAEKIFPFLK
ncbi:flagellar biosynthesis anti-sigma factor FlgM [Paenibacillus validus]|uniref:Negative regulator of flagellin synthesis n=1 Tax=Paenibacillus validus TaxID=44253 RepID=A0A7X2ZCR6_9BACL|nr:MULTISPECIES: flagellar biosynthesis anti-sigma factor FlgM [Paenibacillus]MED4600704.1 flagellar biosynthesis anti-sigma factor FlgM [Paenibacillus validus]MED4606779.1 flagellar biosynthesis anti-sigma factor FlgM [Paenibacillus validus]MUG72467.1 flagellar biosynthesis anti-sigma factor FlgM [Paenibacillus validus]